MNACLPVLVLLLGLATCGRASVLEDLLGFDCIEDGERCNTINRPCCGETVCFFRGGYNVRTANRGECVKCIPQNQDCQRNNQCCQTDSNVQVKCLKEHPFHINGICSPLFANGVKCYKDSQCASDDCDKPRFWHMYGKCTPTQDILEI